MGISLASLAFFVSWKNSSVAFAETGKATQGALQALDASGKPAGICPLKHTDVKAEISGFLSRVVVTQEFENPFKDKIEAVYTFPLPQAAAVDDMTMRVGDRTVRGRILRREEAQAVYEAAREAGQVASLLDQERPNIFTQSVANIMPGEKVTVQISYVERLKYEEGSYEFVFPMVVGPRYVPGTPTGKQGGGRLPDTDRVPDASRITPQVAPEGMRAGHDISVDVTLDAGVPLDGLASKTHEVDIERPGVSSAHVSLKDRAVIPNKDFILRYDVAGRRIEDALLTNRTDKGGFFTLILQPPDRVLAEDVNPKEIVFVLDTSGSMEGFPIEKAKEAMKLALGGLYPQDTFNLITFAGDEHILFEHPVPATKENLQKAQEFLRSRQGSGGTEMMKAIKAALDPSDAQDHLRIVCFMTDGYVGNEMEIVGEIQKHPNARVFSFGIGGSVNRFLLDKMAESGRGEVEYVTLTDDGSAAARRFHERIRNPLFTDITVDWNGLPVADVYPKRIPDLFSAKPVILTGRYTGSGHGIIRLKGKLAGHDFVREVRVDLPDSEARHDVLATLWARTRIDDLMGQDYDGLQHGNPRADLKETITQLGLEYRLMTQFTSFVAVEEMIVTDGGQPRRIDVPVELPEGVSRSALQFNSESGSENMFTIDGQEVTRVRTGTLNNPAAPGQQPSPGTVQMTATRDATAATVTVTAADESAIDTTTSSVSTTVYDANKTRSVGGGSKPKTENRMMRRGRGGNTGGGRGGVASMGKLPAANTVDQPEALRVSPEEQRQQQLHAKLHPAVLALVQRLNKKEAQPGADEAKFVHEGKAELQIWLTDKSPEVLEQLKQLGFEIVLDPKTAKVIIGRLPVDKLEALAGIKAVRYVSPQVTGT
ncbi:MAG TPA: VIT and VWA domain-containing protein [Pyrinomonadaceae bacterium]|nr:VIT and VWA domain-containing protein [Pyrinomonadaceae bacterium]